MTSTDRNWRYEDIKPVADNIVRMISSLCDKVEVAGSIRRCLAFCHDIDIVVVPKEGCWGAICAKLGQPYPSKSIVKLNVGKYSMQVYRASNENWGSMLLWYTGSSQHNIFLAKTVKSFGLRISPIYGITHNRVTLAAKTEEDIYAILAKLTDDWISYEAPVARTMAWEWKFSSEEEMEAAKADFFQKGFETFGFTEQEIKKKWSKHIEFARYHRPEVYYGVSELKEMFQVNLQILQRDGFKCRNCGGSGHPFLNPLQIHNPNGGLGGTKLHNQNECLTLCRLCHCNEENRAFYIGYARQTKDEAISLLGTYGYPTLQEAKAYLETIMDSQSAMIALKQYRELESGGIK